MAAKARSRSTVTVRSSLGGSAPSRSGTVILVSDQLREKRRAAAPKIDAEPFSDRRAKIREGRPLAERNGANSMAEREHRHALACVIGRRRRWVVSVIGGYEEQIVLA